WKGTAMVAKPSHRPRANAVRNTHRQLPGEIKETIMTVKNKASDQAQIRQLIDRWSESLRSKDINAVMSHYAPDIVAFDLALPLQYRGADTYRKELESMVSDFQAFDRIRDSRSAHRCE